MASVGEAQGNTQNALAAAVAAQKFPKEAQDFATKLLTRLEAPTRVTLMGMPKSGKTSILNLLAGRDVVAEGLASTVQLVQGDTDKVTVTLRDGSKLEFEGPPDMVRIGSLTPVFVKIEMNLPALKKISLLEVVTAHDRVEQIRAIRWASKQTDIAIWCSADYDAGEQALWENVPDQLKDHAIFVRSRADVLGNKRDVFMERLQRAAGSDFAYFLPVSAHQAQAARANGSVDKALLKASGAMALISTILRKIEQGRQSAVDQAEILLHKHRSAQPEPKVAAEPVKAKLIAPEPVAAPEPVVTPAPEPQLAEAPEPVAPPVAEPVKEVVAENASVVEPTRELAAPEPELAPEPAQTAPTVPIKLSDKERAAFETAVAHLTDAGTGLTGQESDLDAVIKSSAKTLDWITEYLYEDRWPDTDALEAARNMTQSAADLVELLKIEGGEEGALDAVSAMLQLKRNFQARLAA